MSEMIQAQKKPRVKHVPQDAVGLVNQAIPRLDKAYELIKDVVVVSEGQAVIKSQSNPDKVYHVNYHENSCECPDNVYRHLDCKHIKAVKIVLAERGIVI